VARARRPGAIRRGAGTKSRPRLFPSAGIRSAGLGSPPRPKPVASRRVVRRLVFFW
jgi:hypothetical protein